LSNLPNVIGVKNIENMIKPTNLIINNLDTPPLITYKRSKIKINIAPGSTTSTLNKQPTASQGQVVIPTLPIEVHSIIRVVVLYL
jgi:hypothetical protein